MNCTTATAAALLPLTAAVMVSWETVTAAVTDHPAFLLAVPLVMVAAIVTDISRNN